MVTSLAFEQPALNGTNIDKYSCHSLAYFGLHKLVFLMPSFKSNFFSARFEILGDGKKCIPSRINYYSGCLEVAWSYELECPPASRVRRSDIQYFIETLSSFGRDLRQIPSVDGDQEVLLPQMTPGCTC
jgi:hypothetical protein